MAGPLDGLKVIEMAGLGPAPFCAMMLADMGADVVLHRASRRHSASDRGTNGCIRCPIRRKPPHPDAEPERGRRVGKRAGAVERADILIEGFRPGVMERRGSGGDLPLASPLSRLWPHDRLGTDRSVGPCRRA